MESMNVFSENFQEIIKESVNYVLLEPEDETDSTSLSEDWSKNENNLSCSYCRVKFADSQQQREHYKLDWHRYNLKQSLLQKQSICEDEFNEKNGNDDLSSISGSDSEKEDTLDTYATAQGRIFLRSKTGKVFSIYKCLVSDRKEEVTEETISSRLKDCCITNTQWAVLMLGGGHFAGAVFRGHDPILHKTFHCYTVRAGQGGSQSSRDSKSGGSQPKSAGASLRRYNEQALVQHVRSIVETWKPEIEKCSLIIYRASGPYNRSVLFSGNPPLLNRSDPRLRTVPFSTRRATFTEVQRVHDVLSRSQVYESLEYATALLAKQKSPENESKRQKARISCINRAKSRETVERPLPCPLSNASSVDVDIDKLSIKENDDVDLSTQDIEISFEDLEEYTDSLTPEQRKRQHRKKKPRKSKTKKLKEKEDARKKDMLNTLFNGSVLIYKEKLEKYVKESILENNDETEDNKDEINENEIRNLLLNEALDEDGNCALHIAATNDHIDLLKYLLENNVDLCAKNKKQQTAYTCTQSKEIRDCLKEFARENPDKFNYNKAQIPTNTLTNEELAEKKKAQRKLKKEKEKEKKKEMAIKRKEDEEKERFIKLSDREKRALAAERRILSSSGAVTSRCFLCGSDMAGKVPFEYSGNRFCTIDCLKAHRIQNPVSLT